MPIDATMARADWADGAKAKLEKLIRKYTAKSGKVDAATSDAAQKNYIAGVTDPVSQKLRVMRLKELTDSDLNRGMETKGRIAYPAGVDAAVDKYGRRVEPYFREIDSLLAKLPARTRDARANIMSRALPLGVGLANRKKALLPK